MSNTHFGQSVNTRDWKKLPRAELEAKILKLRREAVHRHLDECEWKWLDRARKYLPHAPAVTHA
jgi:hypothetical protein